MLITAPPGAWRVTAGQSRRRRTHEACPRPCRRQSAARLRLRHARRQDTSGTAQRSSPVAGSESCARWDASTVRIRREFGTNCALKGNPPAAARPAPGAGLAGRDVPDPRASGDPCTRRRARRPSGLNAAPSAVPVASPIRRAFPVRASQMTALAGSVHARNEAAIRAPRRAAGRTAAGPRRRCRRIGTAAPSNGTIVPSSVFQTALSHALLPRRTTRSRASSG